MSDDQLSQRLEMAAQMMGFDPKVKISIELFYKRLGELVALEKQLPFFKVIRHIRNERGRQGAVVSVDYRDGQPPDHLLIFFSEADRIRSIRVFFQNEVGVNEQFEKGMGISTKGEQSSGTFERPRASTGDASSTSHGDSRTRQGEGG